VLKSWKSSTSIRKFETYIFFFANKMQRIMNMNLNEEIIIIIIMEKFSTKPKKKIKGFCVKKEKE
jgi:hypothetical protein